MTDHDGHTISFGPSTSPPPSTQRRIEVADDDLTDLHPSPAVVRLTAERDALRSVVRHYAEVVEKERPHFPPFREWEDEDWADSAWTPAEAAAIRAALMAGVPGGGEPQPGTDDTDTALGQFLRKLIADGGQLHVRYPTDDGYTEQRVHLPVRSVAVGDQPDTPCPECGGRRTVIEPPTAPSGRLVPCPACTDQENPDGP